MKTVVSANWGGPAATNLRWQNRRCVWVRVYETRPCSQALLELLCSWRWPRTHLPASSSEVLALQGHSSLTDCFLNVLWNFSSSPFERIKRAWRHKMEIWNPTAEVTHATEALWKPPEFTKETSSGTHGTATVSLDSGENERCGIFSQTPRDFYIKIKQ